MDELSIGYFLLISGVTLLITALSVRREPVNCKIIYLFVATGVYLYSGIGIAYESVDKAYLVQYFSFLVAILLTIKVILHSIRSGNMVVKYRRHIAQMFIENIDVDADCPVVKALAVFFLLTSFVYLFVPTFRVLDFFRPQVSNIILNNIYDTNFAYDSNIILKLASTLNTMCMPFFLLYVQSLIDKNKKAQGVLLIILWIYLEFLKKNYLGRYKLVTYFIFVFSVIAFLKPKGLKVQLKNIILLFGAMLLTVPFLYSFMAIRSGGTAEKLSFLNSFGLLFESEVYYPTYYDTCSEIFLNNGSIALKFIAYIICLPIPSIIFSGKPTVNASFYLTYAITGRMYGSANYTSCLPSVIGEGIIIWGRSFVWLHGIVLGIVIGIVFKFLMKYKSLTVLYVYYVINLLVIGRGGAESYLSGLINGTICLILWIVILKKYKSKKRTRGSEQILN